MDSGDGDVAEYLQKALGYSMLGMANEECMFILHGKSTYNGYPSYKGLHLKGAV